MRNLLRSRFGRAWSALARDEVAARALGVNLFWQKFSVFGFTSFLIGIQGALLGYYVGVVSSDQFTFDMAVSYVAMVVVGGLGSVAGSVLGAIFVTGLPYLVTYLVGYLPSDVASGLTTRLFAVETLLYGLAIIAFIVFEPRGLVDILRRLVDTVRYRATRSDRENATPDAAPVAATPAAPNAVLAATDLRVTYNHLSTAIDGITVSVGAGEIVVMLGANGAGKTTTLRGISGFLPAENAELTRGEVWLNGDRVNGLAPYQLARRGLVLVPERDKVFRTLTVAENLAVVPTRPGGNRSEMLALVDEIFPALRDLGDRKAGFLSGGERQMLAISKALVADPVLLLVDELSLGIAPFLVTRLVRALDDIRHARGLGILLVEQNAAAALAVADRGYVLQTGRIVLHGTGAELRANPEVQRLYLGGAEPGRYGRLDAGTTATEVAG
jgi:ABC-type branched-subunit amino acid transport system ATPase component